MCLSLFVALLDGTLVVVEAVAVVADLVDSFYYWKIQRAGEVCFPSHPHRPLRPPSRHRSSIPAS